MTCKKCGKKFHYCGSCDSELCMSNGYCSDKCFESGQELREIKELIYNFLDRLDNDSINLFEYFIKEEFVEYLESYYLKFIQEYREENK